MKLPKLSQLKIPNWIQNLKLPKIFQRGNSPFSFYSVWKKFIRQVPVDSRPTIKAYQHFIVLGNTKSGKSDLIHGMTEQSQDLYPFDTSYTASPEIQFYLGPSQVIQEISFSSLEDKSIKVRKEIIRLWKKLYAHRDPIVIVVYNCFSSEHQNLRDLNKLAQLIAGKVSLLSEITKKACKIRIALTHLDKVPGYLEFARFLKQNKLDFNIELSSQFDSNALDASLKKFFEDHLNLMLTTNSHQDFANILRFAKEMPQHFPNIEEFLRALVARVSFAGSVELDSLSFTSNHSSSTSFNSFHWKRLPSMELFFRYPMLKTQIACGSLVFICCSFLLYSYVNQRNELHLAQNANEHLDLLQFKTFEKEILPKYVRYVDRKPSNFLAYVRPQFFTEKLNNTENQLAGRMRKHFIDREVRKAILEHKGELRCLYFIGLMHSTRDNNLGKFILKNSKQIAESLNIQEAMLKAYVNSCSQPLIDENASPLSNINPFLPLTSFNPWLDQFNRIEELLEYPILIDQQFHDVVKETDKLLQAIQRLRSDQFAHPIATLLEEQLGERNSDESIRVVRWMGENIDALESFLVFVQETSTMPVDNEGLNVAQFFTKIKERSALKEQENQNYNFSLSGNLFSFQTKPWIDLIIGHNVEQAIHSYITANTNSGGDIFFINTSEVAEPAVTLATGPVSLFKSKIAGRGRYSRLEYEKKVKATAEKLLHLVDTLEINPEERKRFINFLTHEVINYQKSYQDYYAKYFDLYDLPKNTSLEDLKVILHDLAHLSSSFHDFLHSINYHTSPLSDPILSLKTSDTHNEFNFLTNIFAQDTGNIPLSAYHQIILQLLRDLEMDSPQESFNGILDPYLTPAAAISVHILQQDERSYLIKINECLADLKIPEKYRNPFVKPILQLHQIGLRDLKKSIDKVWSMYFSPRIESMFAKFPFNQNGSVTITLDEINDTLNPKSDFYNTITSVMGICCSKKDGVWHSIDPQNLPLEERITTALTAIQNIANLLWDRDGNATAINLNVKTVPFSPIPNENPVIVGSYLIVGKDSVKNLNQTPSWQNIKMEWWKEDNYLVGVELLNKDAKSKSYRDVQKLHSTWGFFELLREGTQENENTWSWTIANKEGREPYRVSFNFQENPLELLQTH